MNTTMAAILGVWEILIILTVLAAFAGMGVVALVIVLVTRKKRAAESRRGPENAPPPLQPGA
jgi:hypothetical protein